MAEAETDSPGKQALFDRRERGAAFDLLANLLVDAGHADKDGGPDFAHGERQFVELGAVGDLRSGVIHAAVEGASGDVGEGQERDAGVGGAEVEIGGVVALVCSDIAVGEGDALGLTGGAGSVDKGGKVLRLDGAD